MLLAMHSTGFLVCTQHSADIVMRSRPSYASFDPANRQSSVSAKLIAEYAEKANCQTHHASGFARVPLLGAAGVHTLSVVVNGVAGNFILDTGATYVVLDI